MISRNWNDGGPGRIKRFKRVVPNLQRSFIFGKGMEFGYWVDYANKATRSNGYNKGDLIENPAYVIESILRDWVFAERSLRIDVKFSNTGGRMDGSTYGRGTLSSVDDYYNGAIWYNHTTGHKSYVIDYDGTNHYVYINDADVSMATGDWVTLTNIQTDTFIDTASFDAVGNTTNGLRDGYELARSINEVQDARAVIDSICADFLLFVFKSGKKYKIATLEKKATADGTLSNPLKSEGKPLISTWLSDLSGYYSEFILRHGYSHGKGDYNFKMTCNGKGSTSGLGTTFEGYCKTAADQYRQGLRLFDREFPNIYNGMDSLPSTGTTMHNIAKLLIRFYTKLRLMVEYYGDFKEHMKYEVGDQVLINYSDMIPTGLNNSAYFLITGKAIESVNGIPTVRLTLMETFSL